MLNKRSRVILLSLFFLMTAPFALTTVNAEDSCSQDKVLCFSLFGGGSSETFDAMAPILNGSGESDGGYVIAGYSRSTDGDIVSPECDCDNHGGADGLFVMFHSDGSHEVVLVGDSGDEYLYSVNNTSDGGYIAAGYTLSNDSETIVNLSGEDGTNENGYIVKFASDGAVEKQIQFGGIANDKFTEVIEVINDDGISDGYIAVGYTDSPSVNGVVNGNDSNNGRDAMIVKFDAKLTKAEDTLLYGYEGESIRDEGNQFFDVVKNTDGNYVAVGRGYNVDISDHGIDGYIVEFELQQNNEISVVGDSATFFGGSEDDYFYGVEATDDGGVVVAGRSLSTDGDMINSNNDGQDAIIVKYKRGWLNEDGEKGSEWSTPFPGIKQAYFESVITTDDGGYLAVGYTFIELSNPNQFDRTDTSDGLIVKFNSSGDAEWSEVFAGENREELMGVIESTPNFYDVVGFTNSSEFGDITQENHGSYDGLQLTIEEK